MRDKIRQVLIDNGMNETEALNESTKEILLLFGVSSLYCPKCGVEHNTTAYIGFCSEKCLNMYQGNMTANRIYM